MLSFLQLGSLAVYLTSELVGQEVAASIFLKPAEVFHWTFTGETLGANRRRRSSVSKCVLSQYGVRSFQQRKRMRIHLYARARTTVFPVCLSRVAARSTLSPKHKKRANGRPIPETFAAETSDRPSANGPNVVCRCWRAREQSRCSIAVHWRFDNDLAACLEQRSIVALAPGPLRVVNR